MRATRSTLIVLTAGFLLAGIVTVSYAFHSGGVAECVGCHSMHSPAAGGTSLMKGTDASSTCLICHQNAADIGPNEYHVSTAPGSLGSGQAPLQRTPGGDFGWLKKNYNFTVDGTAINEDGSTHGHNIIAGEFGYVVDPSNTNAPGNAGGGYLSADLACNSCHDPHGTYRRMSDGTIVRGGQVGVATAPIIASGSYGTNSTPGYAEPPAAGTALGVYRLLAGDDYEKVDFGGVPAAKVPSIYNRTEASTQTRTAYGYATTGGHTSWDDWCGACHDAMHTGTANVTTHAYDQSLGTAIAGLYNAYVKSGDMTGTLATAFTSLVPFIEGTADYAVLATHAVNDGSFLTGPVSDDRVSCLSCHRAHASGWEYALRWNMGGEFMVYNSLYPGTNTTPTVPQFHRGRTSAETQAAYYDRPVTTFASYQRVLCNKCHAKD